MNFPEYMMQDLRMDTDDQKNSGWKQDIRVSKYIHCHYGVIYLIANERSIIKILLGKLRFQT
jgi:hypothetical protein